MLCMTTMKDKLFTGTVGGDVRMWNTHGDIEKVCDGMLQGQGLFHSI